MTNFDVGRWTLDVGRFFSMHAGRASSPVSRPPLPPLAKGGRRAGFTLVELLIVISILLILTTMVVTVFNANVGGDRMRSAARIAQSAFLGAKDRALHAKDRRGVRLLRDAADGSLANGFAYLQPIDLQRYGMYPGITVTATTPLIEVRNYDTDLDGTLDAPREVRGINVDWDILNQAGYIPKPGRIRIPAGTGQWYTFDNSTITLVQASGPKIVSITLTTNCVAATIPPPAQVAMIQTDPNASCELEIGYEMLPNHAPIALPSGIVIDLYWSQIPSTWYTWRSMVSGGTLNTGEVIEGPDPANAANVIVRNYVPAMDVMYSPRGVINGAIAAQGPIHLLLNDIQDATQGLNPIDANNKGEKLVLSVFPQTGHVQTYPIDPTDNIINATGAAGTDGYADDLFRFAKQGSRSGQ